MAGTPAVEVKSDNCLLPQESTQIKHRPRRVATSTHITRLRCAVSSPMAVRPVGGRLCQGLVQAREVGDHAVHAGDRENAEDGNGGDDQQQLTASSLGAL